MNTKEKALYESTVKPSDSKRQKELKKLWAWEKSRNKRNRVQDPGNIRDLINRSHACAGASAGER